MFTSLKNSKTLRWPLLAANRLLLSPLKSGPPVLRRATYDAMPIPYIVTGNREQFVVATTDKVIGRELFLHGQFDFDKLEAALSILAREGIASPRHLIDVGANIGSIVIPAIKRGYFKSATAIEPHPQNVRLLRTNLELNEIRERVTIFALAVGNQKDAMLHLHESATNSGNHSIGAEGIPVRSTRLNDLNIPVDSSLLWMDIEGYEGHALNGASQLLQSDVPVVSEFNLSFLTKSGGFDYFRSAIGSRRLFDLSKNGRSTTMDELISQFRSEDGYTDIVAIAG